MSFNKRILIIAPVWIGDAVMSHALIRLLKSRSPDCSIDVFAREYLHPVFKRMAEVRNCIVSTFRSGELNLKGRLQTAKDLQRSCYTHAYIIPSSFKSALIPFWAKIPHRVGWRGEQRYFLINDIRFYEKRFSRVVERFVALGCDKNEIIPKDFSFPKLQVSPESLDAVLTRLGIKLSKKPILAISPGTALYANKRWPINYFAEVAKRKIDEGWEIWILGGANERSLAEEVQKACNNLCLDLTGKTDVGEAIDLISMVTVMIANDSGLMHAAAALGTPVVAIYGPTSPTFAPPLAKKAKILSLDLPCSPCAKPKCLLKRTKNLNRHSREGGNLKCLYNLKPEMVLKAITDIT